MIAPAAKAQLQSPLACTGSINSFPYTEDFEANNGNWVAGGTASDWAWGTPAKPVITAAGSGSKAWVTGGLTNSFYNNGENSWLESPCFDFSSLLFPEISFKVFWETEKKFDGASFQYSLDGGNSWILLGSVNSNANCQGENWFNTPGITYLGNVHGWSGNIQPTVGSCQGGGGSNGWLTAKHTLSSLAGKPSVKFRFLFGAGTTCNAYDGFAIDAIKIAEATGNSLQFTTTCINKNTIEFDGTAGCGVAYLWNFDDAGSGTANTSTIPNPTHIFSAPGTYNVSLLVQYASGAPASSTKTVVIIGLTGTQLWPGSCSGSADATLTANATGSAAGYLYSWDTNPAQTTSSISNVGAGTYTVTVSAANACSNDYTFILSPGNAINISVAIVAEKCTGKNGLASSTITGGSSPYNYAWSNGSIAKDAVNLAAGNYSLTVTDANGCSATKTGIVVAADNTTLKPDLGKDQNICTGQSIILNPGSFTSYTWQDNSRAPTYTTNTTGTYFVTVSDASGCTGTDTVKITKDCSGIYFSSAFTPNGDGRNDGFGPLGNLSAIRNYKLSVYNRYGQLVYLSYNPIEKWKGNYLGVTQNTGSFTWMAMFDYNGRPMAQKGMVTILR